ncbi:hypothetical protein [Porphyromonas circumdentaria]|uniref:Fibronectin type-III domain-containing protein n=1 Tax=Porphyromonas circumdentaria TaxID=29524 RepID=A0A1T4Q8J1_9PORP|nr:hypothetical protein [Porphyromonas circumdentaria]MBB6276493.1 hypothetical protein [Porphyromonas circumdentaria]MDO4722562.1 hypothetical protein [Porphyromonas circumdentaria]SJZ99528.1 hypothetical protein SAMN02745171_01723 [Porphyromonas circumdentaria]
MKRIYTLLAVTLAIFASVLSSTAQIKERMIIYPKTGTPFGIRVDHTDSIMFLTDQVDLTSSMNVSPLSGVTGGIKLDVTVGKDVKKICIAFPEKYMLGDAEKTDAEMIHFISRMHKDVHKVDMLDPNLRTTSFELKGMQQGYTYVGIIYAMDEYGCIGPVAKKEFQVPKGPLKGNPKVSAKFSDIDFRAFTVDLEPNSDCAAYYFLLTMKDDPSLAESMKMLHIPDMMHYVVAFGADFRTRQPHVGNKKQTFKKLRPGKEYIINVVMVDADGQMSDIVENKVETKKAGTDQTSRIAVTVSGITSTTATVSCKPDANTSEYRYFIQEKDKYTEEFAMDYIKNTPEIQNLPFEYGESSFTWENLASDTSYYAIAMGMNANNEWGEMTKVEFKTLPAGPGAPATKTKNGVVARENK